MESNQMHIDDFSTHILHDRAFRNNEYRKFLKNCYSFDNVYGIISPDLLKQVIKRAKWNRKFRIFLTDILLYANSSSITDENFELLLHFFGKIRTTYLSALGHLELSFYQMMALNRQPLSLEAFEWLFDNICRYDCFSEGDMKKILRDNAGNANVHRIVLQHCISAARNNYGESKKLLVEM